MLKLRCNSKDSIIDFVEKSAEFKLVKDCYLNLLIRVAFEQQLKALSLLIKKHNFRQSRSSFKSIGNLDKAIKYHTESLNMSRSIYGNKPHPSIADSLNILRILYQNIENYEEAEKYRQL